MRYNFFLVYYSDNLNLTVFGHVHIDVMYESEASCLTVICSKTFYSLFISLSEDFKNFTIGRVNLGKKP